MLAFVAALTWIVGGAVASWLACSTPERAVRIRALAGDIVLCSWARHFTLTVPLSTQVYKWVPVSCWGNLANCGEVTCDRLASRPGEVEIPLAASCYRNRDKHRQLWASLGSKASLNMDRESKRAVGYVQSPYWNNSSSWDLSQAIMTRWNRSSGSTCTWLSAIFTEDFDTIVTAWALRLSG